MLVLPELFVPNRPVSGASRNLPVSFHDLKFLTCNSLITVSLLLIYEQDTERRTTAEDRVQ